MKKFILILGMVLFSALSFGENLHIGIYTQREITVRMDNPPFLSNVQYWFYPLDGTSKYAYTCDFMHNGILYKDCNTIIRPYNLLDKIIISHWGGIYLFPSAMLVIHALDKDGTIRDTGKFIISDMD